jgi:serine/threonine-protein kinase
MGVPERIGRYQVLGELGQGAMGTVYRGRDEGLDRDVAVKVMSKGMADADARARFLREARAAARLQHPNIVVIYELGEHEGAPFMALELLEGVDLQRGIDAGVRPDPRATLPVVLQLLAGLGHAHEHGIVHRDVKPSNVFLPLGRPAKIMDFGVARLAGLGTTTAGVVVGTPNYMSPEQASAGEIDGRSDLFSAGLILYELVTGEKAYQADSLVAILYKILHEPPDLSLIPEGRQWERLRAVLSRALARKADDRYPDARAMSAELALALSDLGGTLDWTAPADQALLVRPRPTLRPTPAAEATTRGAGRGRTSNA